LTTACPYFLPHLLGPVNGGALFLLGCVAACPNGIGDYPQVVTRSTVKSKGNNTHLVIEQGLDINFPKLAALSGVVAGKKLE
jgi:hypothetical protein